MNFNTSVPVTEHYTLSSEPPALAAANEEQDPMMILLDEPGIIIIKCLILESVLLLS